VAVVGKWFPLGMRDTVRSSGLCYEFRTHVNTSISGSSNAEENYRITINGDSENGKNGGGRAKRSAKSKQQYTSIANAQLRSGELFIQLLAHALTLTTLATLN
jgi:hypothetical protein